jgi:hypothetical protein
VTQEVVVEEQEVWISWYSRRNNIWSRRSRRSRVCYLQILSGTPNSVPLTQVAEVEELLQDVVIQVLAGAGGAGGGGAGGIEGHLQEVQQEQLIQVVEVVEVDKQDLPTRWRCTGSSRRFRYRYRKRIKQGQWIVATESTI